MSKEEEEVVDKSKIDDDVVLDEIRERREIPQDEGKDLSRHYPTNDEEAWVECRTTVGKITLHLMRAWSPHGYDRAVYLFEQGYYDQSPFFRVVPFFLVQFGIPYHVADEDLHELARTPIQDDPPLDPPVPFDEGTIAFAGNGDNSRTFQLFISYTKSTSLGRSPWETPIGEISEGMEYVKQFYSYGDLPPWGKGPDQGRLSREGKAYVQQYFPQLDVLESCVVRRESLKQRLAKEAAERSQQAAAAQQRMKRLRAEALERQKAAEEAAHGAGIVGQATQLEQKMAGEIAGLLGNHGGDANNKGTDNKIGMASHVILISLVLLCMGGLVRYLAPRRRIKNRRKLT